MVASPLVLPKMRAMPWFEDQNLLAELKDSRERITWQEDDAEAAFKKLPKEVLKELKDKTRVGILDIKGFTGLEGLHCWMQPFEGFPKLLAPKTDVKIFDRAGAVLFQGPWSETRLEYVKPSPCVYLFLPPSKPAAPKKGLKLKLLGAWRYLRFKK